MALAGYASPILRKAIFDRLNPGNIVEYDVVPLAEAFPDGHAVEPEAGASEAIRCTIYRADGSYCVGYKEINLNELDRSKRWRSVDQTPEQYTKDCTKAMGRALRDGGIPMHLDECMVILKMLAPAPVVGRGRLVNVDTGELSGSLSPDGDDDHPDSGAEELTLEQQVAVKFQQLNGADKLAVSKRARDDLGITNVLRSGEHAETIQGWLDSLHSENEGPDE